MAWERNDLEAELGAKCSTWNVLYVLICLYKNVQKWRQTSVVLELTPTCLASLFCRGLRYSVMMIFFLFKTVPPSLNTILQREAVLLDHPNF